LAITFFFWLLDVWKRLAPFFCPLLNLKELDFEEGDVEHQPDSDFEEGDLEKHHHCLVPKYPVLDFEEGVVKHPKYPVYLPSQCCSVL
jgi:hypothetical protein